MTRCHLHSAGDLEAQLVADGLSSELRGILESLGVPGASGLTNEALRTTLGNKKMKTRYAAALARRIRSNWRLAQRAPAAFRAAIGMLPTLKDQTQRSKGDVRGRESDR